LASIAVAWCGGIPAWPIMRFFRLLSISILMSALVSGCAGPEARYEAMRAQAKSAGFMPVRFGASPPLIGMLRAADHSPILWVVIEGDGHAWLNMRQPSADPTPIDAVGWRLAHTLSASTVLYLARPCQYLQRPELSACSTADWTTARFAEKWVARTNAAIEEAKQATGSGSVVIAGYSGGGLMAALVAARRDDVAGLITVAAPLDHAAWTNYHHVAPLDGSLDAIAIRPRLFRLPQLHIAGADDTVVPPFLVKKFLQPFPAGAPVQMIVLPGVDHRMRATIDLACLRNSSWPVRTVDVPNTCPSPADRSPPK
jgi:pimeloyl-ACP methyl ester carboxylesterase